MLDKELSEALQGGVLQTICAGESSRFDQKLSDVLEA
jgi:hypothetical protein